MESIELRQGEAMAPNDDVMVFTDSAPTSAQNARQTAVKPWKILVVDDDEDVHDATEFALRGSSIMGRPILLTHAHSGSESVSVMELDGDFAVILMDAVMETDSAGLTAVKEIRERLGLGVTRIILRTGQPGQVPELDTVTRFDINDYKTKSELTRDKLLIALISAVRSYDQMRRIESSRVGLEKIVHASNELIAMPGLQRFADGVITQMASIFGVEPEGMVCACDSPRESRACQYEIIAAAGRYRRHIMGDVSDIEDRGVADRISRSLREGRAIMDEAGLTLYFQDSSRRGYAAWIGAERPLREVDEHLIEVFCTNLSLCADNIDLVTRLRRQAYVDSLVSLPNLGAFIERVDLAVSVGAKGKAIALIDLSQFGMLNDTLGHQYGDLLLKAVARRLEGGFPRDCLVARTGTDVFAVLGDANAVTREAILRQLDAPFSVEGNEQRVAVSLGFAPIDGSSESGADYLKNAHIALKRAKSEGMGSGVWYDERLGEESRRRTRILHELREGLAGDQLFLAYQPQVALATGAPLGFEALMRWRMPDGRFVPPDLFIPLAEHSGLIRSMGAWLLPMALAALKELDAAWGAPLRMAVNISAVQLRDQDFLPLLDRAIAESKVDPKTLELEMTESISMFGVAGARKLLESVKERGVSIAIDDFGTGYSSLSSIQSWPVDRLKIDKAFVAGIESPQSASRVVDLIIPLCQRLSIDSLAEGVETETQAARLREMGCIEAQGYLYAKPLELPQAAEWLRGRKGTTK
jgi:diguanylate cyclase